MKPYSKSYLDIPEIFVEDKKLVGRRLQIDQRLGYKIIKVGNDKFRIKDGSTWGILLLEYIQYFFGSWFMKEWKKPFKDQHIIIQWISEIIPYSKFLESDPENDPFRKDRKMPGNYIALFTFAYDIYCIYNTNNHLPRDVVEKIKGLKGDEKILGAMYEARIAALYSRAGYQLEWFHEKNKSQPEFIATHRYWKDSIAVEAKAISRSGVFNRPGEKEVFENIRALIKGHFIKAAEKKEKENASEKFRNLPYFIFIDMNFPNDKPIEKVLERWSGGIIEDIFKQIKAPHIRVPSSFNAIALTNFSWHYHTSTPVSIPSPWILFPAQRSKDEPQHNEHIPLLQLALSQYSESAYLSINPLP